MKNHPFYLLLCIILFSGCEKSTTKPCGLEVTENTASQFLKILFIGNSHTYTYDIPNTIKLMAKSKGDSVFTGMSAPGGYDFQRHYLLEGTISAINSQKWDYVILQESGWRPALPESMADTMIYPYADSLYNLIKANNESTQIILYMTHGYYNGASWCYEDPTVCTYEGMQDRIKNTYQNLSEQLDVPVAPAGIMWNIFRDRYPEITLHQSDGVHANPTGAYISACTIYSLIFKKKPENIYVPANVTEENAQKIQNIVSNALFACNPNWMDY